MKRILVYISALLGLTGCHQLAIEVNIFENYYLIAGDEREGTFLSYHDSNDGSNYSGLIEATVFALGYNDNYMIVKQHPRTFPNAPDKAITNYYILPIKKEMNWQTKNGLLGPMTLEQFNQKRKELKIPDSVAFTKVIEDLE